MYGLFSSQGRNYISDPYDEKKRRKAASFKESKGVRQFQTSPAKKKKTLGAFKLFYEVRNINSAHTKLLLDAQKIDIMAAQYLKKDSHSQARRTAVFVALHWT